MKQKQLKRAREIEKELQELKDNWKDDYKCFWCNKRFKDLVKHCKNKHPNLNPRSYDVIFNKEFKQICERVGK